MKLKLITTETFGTVPCDFYRNMNDDMLLTREQIGQALEYKDPMNAIYKIHKRHEDRLDNLSICLSDGLGHQVYYYTERGLWKSVDGRIVRKRINSWIGYGISLNHIETTLSHHRI